MQETEFQNILATVCFALAILHTFSVKLFQKLAHRFEEGSIGENALHLLGEVETVFGLWAAVLFLGMALHGGYAPAVQYLEGLTFTEPAFVFVIMTVCSTKPILEIAGRLIDVLSRSLPFSRPVSFHVTALIVGPLLGSFITEPAAMTVTALILLERFYSKNLSDRLKYATLGLLFVNISIGGTLTPFAAPPVLMVAGKWGWGLTHMLTNFGWKAALAIVVSTSIVAFRHRDELAAMEWSPQLRKGLRIPGWVGTLHVLFLAAIVASSHHPTLFVGLFLFFLGLATVTREYQSELRLREGLLVAFFLGGLVVLGGPQRWWLEPLLGRLSVLPLYLGAIGLTAITDNAALTYLGSLVPLEELSKYALVAGAVIGGGLTVIANAPNPAGYGLLNPSFGKDGISPLGLFRAALGPTIVAAIFFWFL